VARDGRRPLSADGSIVSSGHKLSRASLGPRSSFLPSFLPPSTRGCGDPYGASVFLSASPSRSHAAARGTPSTPEPPSLRRHHLRPNRAPLFAMERRVGVPRIPALSCISVLSLPPSLSSPSPSGARLERAFGSSPARLASATWLPAYFLISHEVADVARIRCTRAILRSIPRGRNIKPGGDNDASASVQYFEADRECRVSSLCKTRTARFPLVLQLRPLDDAGARTNGHPPATLRLPTRCLSSLEPRGRPIDSETISPSLASTFPSFISLVAGHDVSPRRNGRTNGRAERLHFDLAASRGQ